MAPTVHALQSLAGLIPLPILSFVLSVVKIPARVGHVVAKASAMRQYLIFLFRWLSVVLLLLELLGASLSRQILLLRQ